MEDPSSSSSLCDRLSNPSRPVFLLGDVPPGEGTPPGRCQSICDKFTVRSRALASDGFVVYDIQDEPGRSDGPRPFPFRRVMDSSAYAALLSRSTGKECLVYKCVADPDFEAWLDRASTAHGHRAVNLVGRATSGGNYEGPTMPEAMDLVDVHKKLQFGCVCIAERHTLEAAAARNKPYPTEHLNMLRKQRAGAGWFVSQAVYDAEPTVRLLRDYAALCREEGVPPRKVVLTFAPVSRKKTMDFVKWLGVRVPPEAEGQILGAERPVDVSVEFLCGVLRTILAECSGVGVPLGVSCESVSIYKAEIDGVHELFRRLQGILLDARGSPWKVQWVEVVPRAGREEEEEEREVDSLAAPSKLAVNRSGRSEYTLLGAGLTGVALGGLLVVTGAILGGRQRR